jgi:hypothetical protein
VFGACLLHRLVLLEGRGTGPYYTLIAGPKNGVHFNLDHLGKDPNWRRSPSILDQLRGWTIRPGRPRKAKLASAQKTAAN